MEAERRRRVAAGTLRDRERIAAVAGPVAVFVVGMATPWSRWARLATNATILCSLSGALAVVVASRRVAAAEAGRVARRVPSPPLHVLVPARDEASVVGELIGDLGRQDLVDRSGRPAFTLTVIDDRSTDGTGQVVASAIEAAGLATVATCRRRDGGLDGKGAALASVPLGDLVDDAIVIVLDADARLAPDALTALVGVFESEPPGITARRRMLAPVDGRRGWLARWQDDEQTVDGAIHRGRLALGGTGEFRGDGMALRAGALRAIGGWDAGALTEDLEAGMRLVAATGAGIRWSPEVEVWEQPVLDIAGLVRQRLRWAEGAVRRDLRVTWPLVLARRVPIRLRVDLASYAAQTLVPWLALGLLWRSGRPAARHRLVALGGAYMAGAMSIAATALGRLDRRVPAVIAIGAIWPLVLPIAWVRVALSRGPIRFTKTEHRAGFNPPMPLDLAAQVAPRPWPATEPPRATIHPGGVEASRPRPPVAATYGPRPGSAAPSPLRTCP